MIDLEKPRTRREAVKENLAKYFTGRPCNNGHTTYRYTGTGACAGCVAGYAKRSKGVQSPGISIHRYVHRDDAKIVNDLIDSLVEARKLQNLVDNL